MCWEDMRHYRECESRTQDLAQGATVTVIGNPNRIRFIVCGTYNALTNRTTVFISPNGSGPIGVADNGTPVLVMRIEDYGQVVQGPLLVSNVGGNGPCTITEVISREPLADFTSPKPTRLEYAQ